MKLKHKNKLEISLNQKRGILEFKWKSILEDSDSFFEPVLEWINEYGKKPKNATTVNMFLEYFNTASSKFIMAFLKKLEQMHQSGNTLVRLNWHYEEGDEDMMYMGEEFQDTFNMPVKIIELEEFDYLAN